MQIINGSHHNRAIECHLFTLQALTDMWLDAFFAKHPDVYKSLQITLHQLTNSGKSKLGITAAHAELLDKMTELNIEEMMDEFDSNNAMYPMYKWAKMYMRQVTALLQFLRSTRQQNWMLHLASLEQLCIWFFAYNRLDYAQNIPEYIV